MRDIEKVETMAKGLSPRIPPKYVSQVEKAPTKSNGKTQPPEENKGRVTQAK